MQIETINLEPNLKISVYSSRCSRVVALMNKVNCDIEVSEVLVVLDHLEDASDQLVLVHVELLAE